MQELNESINRRFKGFCAILLVFVILFTNIGSIAAATQKQDVERNKREQQLLRKIEIIHQLFPNQTDKAALYATIAHRGYLSDYINDSYDPDFDEDKFEEEWSKFQTNVTDIPSKAIDIVLNSGLMNPLDLIKLFMDIFGSAVECLVESLQGVTNPTITDENGNYNQSAFNLECVFNKVVDKQVGDNPEHTDEQNVKAKIKNPQAVDLLTAAAIVMIDSSGWWGQYSDENYQKALAGVGLVGNLAEDPVQKFVAAVFNGVFCTAGAAADMLTNGAVVEIVDRDIVTKGFNPTDSFTEYKEMGSSESLPRYAQKLSRYYTMARICSKGYIGGIYDSVQYLEDHNNSALYQPQKDKIAEEIIKLAKELRKGEVNNNCIVPSTGSGSVWKQGDSQWSDVAIADSNVGTIGCLITSIAMQMSRSGTALTNLESFNPGTFAEELNKNGGFTSEGAFNWTGHQNIAANWNMGDAFDVNIDNSAELAQKMSEVLSTPAKGQYQPYVVLQIHHNNSDQHWVAVDGINNGQVTILDPGSPPGNTLDANYEGWVVDSYRVMYATDVPFGSTGSSSTGSLGNTGTANSPATGTHFGSTTTAGLNYCGGSGAMTSGDLMSMVAYLEGTGTCNYNGQGEGTGYAVEYPESDSGGATTAFGITINYDAEYANQVGYTNFINDMNNGCTDKKYIDQMYPTVMGSWEQVVRQDTAGMGLSDFQISVLTSIVYNTGASQTAGYKQVLDRIKRYGVDSFEVFRCMISLGCSFTNGAYTDGLVHRRMAEYEALVTGNLNAAKPSESYSYFQSIDTPAKLQEYRAAHWPSNRANE